MSIRKCLDASTAYITYNDIKILEVVAKRKSEDYTMSRVTSAQHGFVIWICDADNIKTEIKSAKAWGLSSNFQRLIRYASKLGVLLINLDSDGDEDLKLPKAKE